MEVRYDDGRNALRIEADCFHVLGELSSGRGTISPEACVKENELAAGAYCGHGERIEELVWAEAACRECFLHVVERDILDIVCVNDAFDLALVEAEHFDVADLIFETVARALGVGGADERHWTVEA